MISKRFDTITKKLRRSYKYVGEDKIINQPNGENLNISDNDKKVDIPFISLISEFEKALGHTDLLINRLLKKDYKIAASIKTRAERTAILHFKASSFEKTKAVFSKLKVHKVIVTLQGESRRVSPNFFNTKEEIDLFLRFL